MQIVTTQGLALPALGFGIFRMSEPEVERLAPAALAAGFRHFDTAQIYGNEAEVGQTLADSGVARGQVFVTTKIWTEHLAADALIPSLEESLRKLRMDTVDLTLIHWPSPGAAVPVAESMREVASSSSRMRGSPASARAIAISCFWPEDRREPPSPSEVS